MNKKFKYNFIGWLYGLIVVISNICGVLIPNIFTAGNIDASKQSEWMRFMMDYKKILEIPQYLTFIVPTVLCVIYANSKKEHHFINLPIVFSAIGTSGWGLYAVEEIIMVIVALNMGYHVNVGYIFVSSGLNILMEALITFTLAYFITSTIHRKYVLPDLYPEGHINKIKGVKQPSIRFLFLVNYLSVTLFPVVFLLMIYLKLLEGTETPLDLYLLIMIGIILFFGLVITAAFSSYFDKPILKLKKRIELIEDGDYKSKTRIVTNDSFGELSDILNDMTESLDAKTQKIYEIQNSIVTGMATMVESRDNSTGGHIKRTSDCVRVFINELIKNPAYSNLSETFCTSVIKAAPMHDLGKIAVDDAILRKPGKFTDEEYEKMKIHPEEGAKIVEKVLSSAEDEELKKIAINVAHYHHEKWNGQGYPCKISGEAIPLESRIMALADVFDALVSKRCYKDSFTYEKALEIIKDSLGSHFDPKLGEEFIKCRPQLEELYNSYE